MKCYYPRFQLESSDVVFKGHGERYDSQNITASYSATVFYFVLFLPGSV